MERFRRSGHEQVRREAFSPQGGGFVLEAIAYWRGNADTLTILHGARGAGTGGAMNRYQAITLVFAAANLLLAFLFPPFDYISPARSNVPTFEGFALAFGEQPNRVINSSFLQIEAFVILINAAIAWLLLKDRPRAQVDGKTDWQRVMLFGVGINLLLALLFPPMENYYAVTRAVLPSFDGFYFLFGEHGTHTIVTAILYIEVFIIMVNGTLLYLLFRNAKPVELSADERAAIVDQLQQAAGRR
jgi:hypothetical protein